MKSVGQILKETRLTKKLSVSEVEAATKIRVKFLEAIERDDFTLLPSINYAKGFVKNYAEYLGLNSKNVLAFFRRQTTEIPRSAILPKEVPETLRKSPLRLTPSRFIGMLVTGIIVLFLGYFVYQYQALNRPPGLQIDEPKDNQKVNVQILEVLGKTVADATVTINGTSVLVRDDGKFFDKITLSPGENTVTVISTSRFGKSTTQSRKVVYDEVKR